MKKNLLFIIILSLCSFGKPEKNHIQNAIKLKTRIDTVIIKHKTFDLYFVRKEFKEKMYNLDYSKLTINNEKIYGTDGDFPKYELSEAYVVRNEKKIQLNTKNMYNPWFDNGESIKRLTQFKTNENETLIFSVFSDGAGSYACEWKVFNDKSKRIKLSADESFIFKYE